MAASEKSRSQHSEYQRRYFDTNCDFFRQPVPEEIEQRTRDIVASSGIGAGSTVLDVGTGMGVLLKHFVECGVSLANVTGCDLSANMLAEARNRYPGARFWQGDIVEFPVKEYAERFDAIFFNACFGNIYDQVKALTVAKSVLAQKGVIVISHPLGNEFVQRLKDQDRDLVLTLMPDRDRLKEFCDRCDLQLKSLEDRHDFYLAVFQHSQETN